MNMLMDQKLEHGELREFVMSSLMGEKLQQENMKRIDVEVPDGSKVESRGRCDRTVRISIRTVEKGSEHAACQVKVQEKVVTTWLFDTGADAHVMPKCVWEQLGEPALQTTNVTLRGANGQDLGAMVEVQVRGFIGKIKVQFTAVVARDARRCLLSGTQLRTKGHTFSLNQRESFLTQPKDGQRVTMSREGNRETHSKLFVC